MDDPYTPGRRCYSKCVFFNTKFDFKICFGHRIPGSACSRETDPKFCPFIHTPPPIMNDVVKALDLWDFPNGDGENMDIFLNLFPGQYEEKMWKRKHSIIVLGFRTKDYMRKWHIHSKIHIHRNEKFTELTFWVEHNSSVYEDGEEHFNRVMARCKEIMDAWEREGLKITEG